jgi:hypothetical protein
VNVTCAHYPLVAVLDSSGWEISDEETPNHGRHVCHARQGKYHLIGEGDTFADAQVEVLKMVVQLEKLDSVPRSANYEPSNS